MKGILYGSGVLWRDLFTICDFAYLKRINRFNEAIDYLEGECIQYDVTYELVRSIYNKNRFKKFTSGRIGEGRIWEFFKRKILIDNLEKIIDEDKNLNGYDYN